MITGVTSLAVDDDRPLIEILANDGAGQATAFVRQDEGVIGWGVAQRWMLPAGPRRFHAAQQHLESLVSRLASEGRLVDEVRQTGSGLIGFLSATFDADRAGSVLIAPRVIVGRRATTTWRTVLTSDDGASYAGNSVSRAQRDAIEATGGRDRPRFAGASLRDDAWLVRVQQAIDRIGDGRLDKVVIARDHHLWSRTPFDATDLLLQLVAHNPQSFAFAVDGLVGASPELLLRRLGDTVESEVLAGTTPRGTDPVKDEQLGAALLESEKDRWEHSLAVRSVTELLTPACAELAAPSSPRLLRLPNVQHLATWLTGTLKEPLHVLTLIGLLHPTAAVGGSPRDLALATIRELEAFDRGRYSGPVGWFHPSGDGEFAIALRCAMIEGGRAQLFAGAGIVSGSLPELELEETRLKMRTMRDVLAAQSSPS